MPTGNPPCNAHAHLGSRHPRAPGAGGVSWDRLQLRVTPAAPGLVPLLVTILRERGYAAGATNKIDRTLDLFDAGQFDLVVFGGMVPSDTKEHLREQISTRKPGDLRPRLRRHPRTGRRADETALSDGTIGPSASIPYDGQSRSIGISLDADHRASPSSPGGPPRSSPRNRKHLTSNSGRGTPHRRAHHRDPG